MNNALIFISASLLISLASFILNKEKTILGFKKGLKMLKGILLPFLNILILVSVVLYLIPPEIITKYLGAESGTMGYAIASIIGSITLIPGFISYPIAGGLIGQGASYGVIATFMTSMMMVGVVTLPLEIKYFGKKVAIVRNVLNFFACLIIGVLVGLILQN